LGPGIALTHAAQSLERLIGQEAADGGGKCAPG
jgi:hypothetical protein